MRNQGTYIAGVCTAGFLILSIAVAVKMHHDCGGSIFWYGKAATMMWLTGYCE